MNLWIIGTEMKELALAGLFILYKKSEGQRINDNFLRSVGAQASIARSPERNNEELLIAKCSLSSSPYWL